MTDGGYYKEQLAAERLQQCYRLAPGRVRQYLRAEVDFATTQLGPDCVVLDLGCGYGRTLADFAAHSRLVVGADNSYASVHLGRQRLGSTRRCALVCGDAGRLGFASGTFDRVVCIQTVSAFGLDRRRLVKETLRLLGHGGLALFSTYADEFWDDRLDWFERQSAAGLIGPIDRRRTRDGVIVCTDGFRAATVARRRVPRCESPTSRSNSSVSRSITRASSTS